MLLSAVINEKKPAVPRKRLQWREILKLAEFHKVVTPVYYGILGLEKEISGSESEKFYGKYRKELLTGEAYKDAEEVIEWQLAQQGIHGILLKGTESRMLYSHMELGYTPALEILVEEENLSRIHTIMTEMDYELEPDRMMHGKVYTRVPGIRVIFYHEVPVGNKVLYKYLTEHTRRYLHIQKKKSLFPPEVTARYLYYIGSLADAYMQGELRIRDILDYYQFLRRASTEELFHAVDEILEKSGLAEFEIQLEILAQLWFGQGGQTDTARAFMLEEYIFSKGMESRMLDSSIIPYEKTRVDFYRRDREEEWGQRRMEWFFPPLEYMVQIFPVLDKFPRLLVICWGLRGIRFFRKSMVEYMRRLSAHIRHRFSELKNKIINKIHKGREPEHEKYEDR